MDEQTETEAEKLVDEMFQRHGDVINPLVGRLNEAVRTHDGDSLWFLYENLHGLAQGIREMLSAGKVIPREKINDSYREKMT